MRHQVVCRLPIATQPAEQNASHLARKHAALKERVMRSAYTDDYTRTEREGLRDELTQISARHQTLTGHRLI